MVRGVLLVFTKVFDLLSLGFIYGGSSNPHGRFLFSFEGSFFYFFIFYFKFFLYGPQVDPLKRFQLLRLGVRGVPPEERLLQVV